MDFVPKLHFKSSFRANRNLIVLKLISKLPLPPPLSSYSILYHPNDKFFISLQTSNLKRPFSPTSSTIPTTRQIHWTSTTPTPRRAHPIYPGYPTSSQHRDPQRWTSTRKGMVHDEIPVAATTRNRARKSPRWTSWRISTVLSKISSRPT